MAITVQCGCGKRTSVADALAGRNVRCSACGNGIAVPMAAASTGKAAAKKQSSGPKFYISTGKIVMASILVILMVCGLLFYFGPMSVWHQWEQMGTKASDDVNDIIGFGLQAYLSTHGEYDPSKSHNTPSVQGDVIFFRPTMVMSMPEKVHFQGKSNQGDYSGSYSTTTGEIEADVSYGGYSVAGLVDVSKPTGSFHMIGRKVDGHPEAEVDGKKIVIVYPKKVDE
jgi:hypothetical protein